MVDVLPRKLGHVDEPVHAAEIDKRAERNDRGHSALTDFANFEVREKLVASLFLVLFEVGPTREDDIVTVLIELDDLRVNLCADIGRKVPNATKLNERCWQEATQTDVNNEATLNYFNDWTGDDLVSLFLGLDVTPSALVLSTLLREKEPTLFVFHREHEGFNDLAHRDHFAGVDVVTDAELTARDYALALVSDVQQDFVLVDLDDGSVDHHAVFDLDHGAIDRVGKRHTEIVGGDLAGGVISLVVEGAEAGVGFNSRRGFRILFDCQFVGRSDGISSCVGQGLLVSDTDLEVNVWVATTRAEPRKRSGQRYQPIFRSLLEQRPVFKDRQTTFRCS